MRSLLLKKRPFIISKYLSDFKDWSLHVNQSTNLLAISRKGPRLIELLYEEGLINNNTLDGTFSEYAMPFIKISNELTIIDDSVLYGSTITKNIRLAKKILGVSKENIEVIPFNYSTNTPEEVKKIINRTVSRAILPENSACYISSLITSFKSLGKPYDIEYPIIYLDGDFSDKELLEIKLDSITRLISNYKLIKNVNTDYPDSYTILIHSGDKLTEEKLPEFSKFRIYLNESCTRLTIAPIAPYIIKGEDVSNLGNTIDKEYKTIWEFVSQQVNFDKIKDEFYTRSLVVFANYLNSYSLFLNCMSYFEKYFCKKDFYLGRLDLQFLLGYELSSEVIIHLNKLIWRDSEEETKVFTTTPFFSGIVKSYILPESSEENYNSFFKSNIDTLKFLKSESEILNSIFYAQHKKIELGSRDSDNFYDENRLKFGFSLKHIVTIIKEILPNYSIENIHSSIDKLIDTGAIVPKYLNRSLNTKDDSVWGRVFRVGEGPIPTTQKILTLITLFNNLKNYLGSDSVPAVLLEKYTVIGLTNAFKFDGIEYDKIHELGIRKKCSLYGARSFIATDPDGGGVFFLDWAIEHKILKQNERNEYVLNSIVTDNYHTEELVFSNSTKDKLEDIANFCYNVSITNGLREDALVTITTLATENEYYDALTAELFLWLSHPSYNIYNCVHKLEEIKSDNSSKILNECNLLLESNANFTAQVTKKKSLFQNYDDTLAHIGTMVESTGGKDIKRVWRNIYDNLKEKQEGRASNGFIEENLTILRIAHRLTSLCRTLLNKAGLPVPPDKLRSYKSINQNLRAMLDLLDLHSQSGDSQIIRNQFDSKGIQLKIRKLLAEFDEECDYNTAIQELRDTIYSIADACYSSYYTYGIEPIKNNIIRVYNPPVFIVMWDMRNSTSQEDRIRVEQETIFPINEKISRTIGNGEFDKPGKTADDGNFFLTRRFQDVVSAFLIIAKIANSNNQLFRVGCDVNFEGELHYYPQKGIVAGRAFEYTARTTAFFKEIKQNPNSWNGDRVEEKSVTYLLVSEFAKRIAESNVDWSIPPSIQISDLPGQYSPRVKAYTTIPYKIHELTIKEEILA